jgi:hypothetical protein
MRAAGGWAHGWLHACTCALRDVLYHVLINPSVTQDNSTVAPAAPWHLNLAAAAAAAAAGCVL